MADKIDTQPGSKIERSGPQLDRASILNGELFSGFDCGMPWERKLKQLLCDPTINLVRHLFVAPILTAGWSVDCKDKAPKGARDFLREEVEHVRHMLLKRATLGCIDWGWQPFEVVYRMTEEKKIGLCKIKPLLQVLTKIKVGERHGEFRGFTQDEQCYGSTSVPKTTLSKKNSLLFNFDVEGTDWHGRSMLRNAEKACDDWNKVTEAAKRYDKKMAGAHWIVYYPKGYTEINGQKTHNSDFARMLLVQLESSGCVALPASTESMIRNLHEAAPGWKIELLTVKGSVSTGFNERCAYLDKLKVRAFGFPERSILEGTHGTKADAGSHGDFALSVIELRHCELVMAFNEQIVQPLMVWNYGKKHRYDVFIRPNALDDLERKAAADIYNRLLANPNALLEEFDSIDTSQLRKILGIPESCESDLNRTSLRDSIDQTGQNQPFNPGPSFRGQNQGPNTNPGTGTNPLQKVRDQLAQAA